MPGPGGVCIQHCDRRGLQRTVTFTHPGLGLVASPSAVTSSLVTFLCLTIFGAFPAHLNGCHKPRFLVPATQGRNRLGAELELLFRYYYFRQNLIVAISLCLVRGQLSHASIVIIAGTEQPLRAVIKHSCILHLVAFRSSPLCTHRDQLRRLDHHRIAFHATHTRCLAYPFAFARPKEKGPFPRNNFIQINNLISPGET
jgi:hypothetical protein